MPANRIRTDKSVIEKTNWKRRLWTKLLGLLQKSRIVCSQWNKNKITIDIKYLYCKGRIRNKTVHRITLFSLDYIAPIFPQIKEHKTLHRQFRYELRPAKATDVATKLHCTRVNMSVFWFRFNILCNLAHGINILEKFGKLGSSCPHQNGVSKGRFFPLTPLLF